MKSIFLQLNMKQKEYLHLRFCLLKHSVAMAVLCSLHSLLDDFWMGIVKNFAKNQSNPNFEIYRSLNYFPLKIVKTFKIWTKHHRLEQIWPYIFLIRRFAINENNPVDAGPKFNVHKTLRRRPGRLLNVLCTFNLRPVST